MISILRHTSDKRAEYRIKGYSAFATEVIDRRGCKCERCGFTSKRHMELVSTDGRYDVFNPSGFQLVCPFCFMVERLDHAKDRAVLIYLPEIEQRQLNMIVHALWYYSVPTKNAGSTQYHYSTNLLRELTNRSDVIERTLGKSAHEPGVMAQTLRALSDSEYEGRKSLLEGVRLLPRRAAFITEIEFWCQNVYPAALGKGSNSWDVLAKALRMVLPDVEFPDN